MIIGKPFNDVFAKKLLVYCILTGEVGKPSERYIDSFVLNFVVSTKNGYWDINDTLKKKLKEMVKNNDAIRVEGGVEFYSGIKVSWDEEQIRDYIDTYVEEVKEEDEEVDELELGGEEMISWLRDDCLIDMKGDGGKRGPYNGVIRFNRDKGNFIIMAGSQATRCVSNKCPEQISKYELRKMLMRGIINKDALILKDYEVNSIGKAWSIINMSGWAGYNNIYIHGTNISLIKAKEDSWIYNFYIKSRRSLKL